MTFHQQLTAALIKRVAFFNYSVSEKPWGKFNLQP